MSQWIWSAQTGLLFGALAFVIVFIPILIVQYRRFGGWNGKRMLGAAAGSVYVTALATYTWLPLPPRDEAWCAANGVSGVQTRPFAFVGDILKVVDEGGWARALTSPEVLQVAFNVLLFIPWGVIVRRYLQQSVVVTTITGALGSLFIEATQATGLWFIYPCAYRVADVDDLMANTLGALIGALLGPALLFWMPRTEALSARRLVARPVSAWRRLTSMVITAGAIVLATYAAVSLGRIALLALGQPLMSPTSERLDAILSVVVVLLLVYLPAIKGEGSVGMHAVWLAPRWRTKVGTMGEGTLIQRMARAGVIGVPLLVQAAITGTWPDRVVQVVAFAAIASIPWSRGHRGLSAWLTGAEIIDTRTELHPTEDHATEDQPGQDASDDGGIRSGSTRSD